MTDPSPDLESDHIKSMGLYHHVDRVGSEVRDLGRSDDEPLRADELTAFDQLHYHGTEAVDEAVRSTGINQQSAVLEVGSGIGGPARHLASTTGAAGSTAGAAPPSPSASSSLNVPAVAPGGQELLWFKVLCRPLRANPI